MAQGGEQIVKLDLVRKMFLSVETNVSRLCALIDGGRGGGVSRVGPEWREVI